MAPCAHPRARPKGKECIRIGNMLASKNFLCHNPRVPAAVCRVIKWGTRPEWVPAGRRQGNPVPDFPQDYYRKNGIAPMVRILSKNTGYKLKEVYELFPSGPGKGACKMAGLPKPTGCV